MGIPPDMLARYDRERECVFATGAPLAGSEVYPTPWGLRHYDYLWTPLSSQETGVFSVLFTAHDVTFRRREEQAREFLTRASEVFASSLDYEQTLQQVADLAVPHIADWCGVDMLGADSTISLLAVAHIDPEKVAWGHELAPALSAGPAATERSAPGAADRKIGTLSLRFGRDAGRLGARCPASGDDALYGARSVMIVPILGRESVLGAITFVTTQEFGPRATRRPTSRWPKGWPPVPLWRSKMPGSIVRRRRSWRSAGGTGCAACQ